MGFPVRTGKAEASKVGGYSLSCINGKWVFERSSYYRQDIQDREHYPVVGHIDVENALASLILAAVKIGGKNSEA